MDGFATLMQRLTAFAAPGVSGYQVLDGGPLAVGVIQLSLSRPDGEDLEMPVVELYTVTDGRISRIDVYPKDTRVMADFLGASAGAPGKRPQEPAAGRQQTADHQ